MAIKSDLIENSHIRASLCRVDATCKLWDLTSAYCIIVRLMGFHIQYDSKLGRAERSWKVERISKLDSFLPGKKGPSDGLREV